MPWQSVTLAQARDQLKSKWERVPFWSDEQARRALNEAIRTWNLLTGMWKRRVVIPTPAPSSPWIALPSMLTYAMKVNFISSPLMPASRQGLDQFRIGWEGETTASGGDVPSSPKLWAPAGLTLIAVWPADAVGGQSLVADGIAQTPVLVNDGDFLDIGEHELDAILGFALHVAAFKAGSPLFPGTYSLRRSFLAAAVDLNTRLRASAYFRRQLGLDLSRLARPFRAPDPISQAKQNEADAAAAQRAPKN